VEGPSINIDEESARERQSRVVRSGKNWEKYVKLFLEEKVKGTGIEILWEHEAQKNRELRELLSLPTGLRTESEWDDVDLLAVKNGLPIAVLNCKSSIHGRFSFYFWALLFKINRRMKFVIVSPDSGAGGETWRSEWGTPDNPSKYRELARRYVDAIYIENVPDFCKNLDSGQGTAFGDVIRPLRELPEDISRWCGDLKFYGKRTENGKLESFT
jgi:hypothetical protein